jgi:hypothetical protein
MADRTESLVLNVEVDEGEAVESINSLTKANKALREERNKLNVSTEQGQKRSKEINATIDQNTAKIKANVSAIEQQKINIGNYKSALDGVHPALGKVGEGLEAGASGFKAMARSALAFIATPIGAALAAIVAVFTLLKSAISTNNELFDKFENITTAVGQVITVLVNRVGKLGEALIALASGNFSEAFDKAAEAVGGLGDELERAVGEGQVLLEMSRDLEDAQRQLRIEQAKQENVIKQLVVASKNRNLTFDQQEEKLKEALRLEQGLVKIREELAMQELEISVRKLANDENIRKSSQETFQEFAERLIKMGQLSDAQVDPLVEQIEKLEAARGSSLAFQEKLENSLAGIQEKRALALEKQNAALAEQAALQRAIDRQNANVSTATNDPLIGAFETQAKVRVDIEDRMQDELKARKDASALEDIQRARKGAALEEQIEREKVAAIGNMLGGLAALAAEDSEEHKILASAQALINTYLAATAALASGSEINPVFGIISAAIAVANGLASVAKINGVEFAEGGWTGPGSKMKPAGIVHADEYVTPKWLVNSRQAQPHISALETMRTRGYADGGLVANSITQPINQQMELMNIVKSLPPAELSVKEVTTVQKRIKVKENVSSR